MTDHHSLWWTCGTTGVNESTAVSWFWFIHTVLDCIFWIFRIVLGFPDLNQLVPRQNSALHWSWEIFWNRIFPDNKILDFRNLINYLGVFFQLVSIFEDDDFTLWMVGDVFACLRPIGRVNTDRKIVSEHWTGKGYSPLMRIETDDVDGCVITNSQRYQGFGKVYC